MMSRALSSAGASCSYSSYQAAASFRPTQAPSPQYGSSFAANTATHRNMKTRCTTDGRSEKFWSVTEILQEARQDGSESLVFEDNDEDEVWDLESRVATQPLDLKDVQDRAEVEGALSAEDQDILSAYSSEQGFKETTVAELRPQLDRNSGLAVLDVRTQQEFKVGHVPGAVNIPLDGLSDAVRMGTLDDLKHPQRTICVICASGGRSAQATVRLSRVFGFPDVVNVAGGTSEWINAGFPIEKC